MSSRQLCLKRLALLFFVICFEKEKYEYIIKLATIHVALKRFFFFQETLKSYRSIGENSKQIDDNLEHLLRHADLPRLKTQFSVT